MSTADRLLVALVAAMAVMLALLVALYLGQIVWLYIEFRKLQ